MMRKVVLLLIALLLAIGGSYWAWQKSHAPQPERSLEKSTLQGTSDTPAFCRRCAAVGIRTGQTRRSFPRAFDRRA